MSTVDYFSETDLSALVLPSEQYSVVAALASQLLGPKDTLIDSVEISFTVTGRPGVFTVELPIVGFRVFESGIDLTSEADIVNQLYAL